MGIWQLPIDKVWQLPNIADMNLNVIISKIESYCAATGMKPSTVCQNALGNARFYDRAKRRLEADATSAQKLLDYMEKSARPKALEADDKDAA